jgi:hypothetical protein
MQKLNLHTQLTSAVLALKRKIKKCSLNKREKRPKKKKRILKSMKNCDENIFVHLKELNAAIYHLLILI